MRSRQRSRESTPVAKVATRLCIALGLVFALSPIGVMMAISGMEKPDILSYPPAFPVQRLTISNYSSALNNGFVVTGIRNGAIVALATTLLSLFIGLPAAWGLSKYPSKRSGGILIGIMSTQMVPLVVLVIPIYQLFTTFRLMNNPAALVVVYCSFCLPFTIWMAKGFFDHVPRELVEAASIDGVSRLGTLFRIGLPLVRSGVVAIGIFSFLLSWDEYLVASTLLQRDEYRTMPTQLILSFIGQFAYQWGPMMAAAVMVSIPIFVLFLTFQRQIVAGLTAGAVKG